MAKPSQIESRFTEALIVLVLLTFVMWDPLRVLGSDLLLRIGGTYAPGLIISAEEDIEDGPKGNAVWFHSAVYTFKTIDGKELEGVIQGTGRLRSDLQHLNAPVAIVVEYLPRYPNVNRPRDGQVPQSWIGLMLRAAIGLAFIACWVAVLVIGIRKAAHKIGRR